MAEQATLQQRRNKQAIGVFILFTTIIPVLLYLKEVWYFDSLFNRVDESRNGRLNADEVSKFLTANGVGMCPREVDEHFHLLDRTGDDYDRVEMLHLLEVIADFPQASDEIKRVVGGYQFWVWESILCFAIGSLVAFLVWKNVQLRKLVAHSAFQNTVDQLLRDQKKCNDLRVDLTRASDDLKRVDAEIEKLATASGASAPESEERLSNLRKERVEKGRREEEAKRKHDDGVAKLQEHAEECRQEASSAKNKADKVLKCVESFDLLPFMGQGRLKNEGALRGFSSGFAVETLSFGILRDGPPGGEKIPHMYEARINEGVDKMRGKHRCTEVSTGKQFGLQLFKVDDDSWKKVKRVAAIETKNLVFVLTDDPPKLQFKRTFTPKVVAKAVWEPHCLIAIGVLVVLFLFPFVCYWWKQQFIEDLVQSHDTDNDGAWNANESARFLAELGYNITAQAFLTKYAAFDVHNDGKFDPSEVLRVFGKLASDPVAPDEIKRASRVHQYLWLVCLVCFTVAAGVIYLIRANAALQERYSELRMQWAANMFVRAWRVRREQRLINAKATHLAKCVEWRRLLEAEVEQLEAVGVGIGQQKGDPLLGPAAERETVAGGGEAAATKEATLSKLRQELDEARSLERAAEEARQENITSLQETVKTLTQEATTATSQMEKFVECIDAKCCKEAGLGEIRGADNGFHNFAMDTYIVGTFATGKLRTFEINVSESNKLGRGRDAAYRATELGTLATRKKWAAKPYVHRKRDELTGEVDEETRKAIRAEVQAYQQNLGKHPGIVGYELVIETKSMLFVLMELIEGMDLHKYAISHVICEVRLRDFTKQLVCALGHMHGIGAVHGDIRLQNVMVTKGKKGRDVLKLIDFGTSCFPSDPEAKGSVVWGVYTAPEVTPKGKPTTQMDIFALGCLLFMAKTTMKPFPHDQEDQERRVPTAEWVEARRNGTFRQIPEYEELTAPLKDLLGQMLSFEKEKRPTTAQILQHKWVRPS